MTEYDDPPLTNPFDADVWRARPSDDGYPEVAVVSDGAIRVQMVHGGPFVLLTPGTAIWLGERLQEAGVLAGARVTDPEAYGEEITTHPGLGMCPSANPHDANQCARTLGHDGNHRDRHGREWAMDPAMAFTPESDSDGEAWLPCADRSGGLGAPCVRAQGHDGFHRDMHDNEWRGRCTATRFEDGTGRCVHRAGHTGRHRGCHKEWT